MTKSPDAFRSIGEVARLIGVAPHVLRYWEDQFSQLSPVKRADGRRYYRPGDVQLAAGLVGLLREDGMTIRGARKILSRDRGAAIRARGAARLGMAPANGPGAEAKTLDGAVAPQVAAATAPALVAPNDEAPNPAAPNPAAPNPAAPSDEAPRFAGAPEVKAETRQPPAPLPRSADATEPEGLPLFPDLAPPRPLIRPSDSWWLERLTLLSVRLKQHDAPLPPRAQRLAGQLLELMRAA